MTTTAPETETVIAPDIPLRNTPTQARSNKRLESILNASRKHYDDVGRDRFNTSDIAALAECSIGTVYRYFHDRVAILDAIHPDRDKAEIKLEAVRSVGKMGISDAERWTTVQSILDQ